MAAEIQLDLNSVSLSFLQQRNISRKNKILYNQNSGKWESRQNWGTHGQIATDLCWSHHQLKMRKFSGQGNALKVSNIFGSSFIVCNFNFYCIFHMVSWENWLKKNKLISFLLNWCVAQWVGSINLGFSLVLQFLWHFWYRFLRNLTKETKIIYFYFTDKLHDF